MSFLLLPSYLRDFGKLCVGLAALLRRLHSQFVVVHERSVNSELAGLEHREERKQKRTRFNNEIRQTRSDVYAEVVQMRINASSKATCRRNKQQPHTEPFIVQMKKQTVLQSDAQTHLQTLRSLPQYFLVCTSAT